MPISKIGSKGVKDAELSADDMAPGQLQCKISRRLLLKMLN